MKALLIIPFLLVAGCQTTQQPARVYYPVEVCGNVQVPIYGVLDRPASDGEILGGAVIGGVIGNAITDDTGGAVVGAIIGGALSNDRRKESVIVGYETKYQCRTEYK